MQGWSISREGDGKYVDQDSENPGEMISFESFMLWKMVRCLRKGRPLCETMWVLILLLSPTIYVSYHV